MTETGGGVVYDGRPLDGVEVSARDGEILVRGPMLLRAYRGTTPDGEEPKDGDGWFATDDAGDVLADGTVVVQGRRGDLIVSGGENVWPAAVERVLAGHPEVVEVAVIGRPDPEWGQRVVALIVAQQPEHPPTLEELRAWARAELPAHAAPRDVELVAALPRTPLGKVDRGAL
jgi:O-succinylbenzoic acid--CoA ligase